MTENVNDPTYDQEQPDEATDPNPRDLPYKDDTSDGTTARAPQNPEDVGDDAGVDEDGN